jgi:hypothetical protein
MIFLACFAAIVFILALCKVSSRADRRIEKMPTNWTRRGFKASDTRNHYRGMDE